MFHFTELKNLRVFFLKPDLIQKLHLLKPNALLSTLATIIVTLSIMDKGKGKSIMDKGKSNIKWLKDAGNHHY